MWPWPAAFEYDWELRKAFESACEAQAIYGIKRNQWKPIIRKANAEILADFIWNKAKKLLNM